MIASDKENEVRVMLHQTALLACGYLLVGNLTDVAEFADDG